MKNFQSLNTTRTFGSINVAQNFFGNLKNMVSNFKAQNLNQQSLASSNMLNEKQE